MSGPLSSGGVRVSIVVPCFNSAAFLSETVASVQAQTFSDWELVFVDDGSTDGTFDLLTSLVASSGPGRMTAVRQPNAGVAAARNQGIALARGAYVLPLDADDRLTPEMLAGCVRLLDEQPDVSVAYPDRRDFGALEGVHPGGAFTLARLKYFNQLAYCALFRRALWEEVGGYRRNVDGFDDWDFWLAAAARGHRGQRWPFVGLEHRRHAGSQLGRVIGDYERLFATIISNNRSVYEPAEVAAAEGFLASGRPAPLLQAGKQIFLQRYAVTELRP